MMLLGCKSERKGIASMAKSIQQNGGAKKKGMVATLFEDLSIAQVIAGALAAATVFLLSSVIGVAGSLIGAAVGSVVSAVSSQIYKKMLSASADKLRDAAPGDVPLKQADPDETRLMNPVPSDKTHVIDVAKVDAGVTKVMGADDVRYQAHAATGQGKSVDPAVQRAHVRRHRKARVQRNVIIVSIVSALIAIAISAGLIHVFTAGQGIGEKTDPIFTATDTAQTKQEAASENKTANTEKATKESSSANTSTKEKASSTNNSSSSNSSNASESGNSNSSSSGSNSASSGDSGSSSNSGSSSSGSESGSSTSGSSNGSGSTSGNGSAGSGSSSDSASSGGSASTESANG